MNWVTTAEGYEFTSCESLQFLKVFENSYCGNDIIIGNKGIKTVICNPFGNAYEKFEIPNSGT